MSSIISRDGRYSLRWRDRHARQHGLSLGEHDDITVAGDRFISAVLDAEPGSSEAWAAYRRLERFEAGLRRFLRDTADA